MSSEKAVDMKKMITNVLERNGIDKDKVISFCADNTMSNFGGHARGGNNNVFALWKIGFSQRLIN